jgi:hypothetical protein
MSDNKPTEKKKEEREKKTQRRKEGETKCQENW